jgi:subtilase family serine protease
VLVDAVNTVVESNEANNSAATMYVVKGGRVTA